jgi:hypothetical protein
LEVEFGTKFFALENVMGSDLILWGSLLIMFSVLRLLIYYIPLSIFFLFFLLFAILLHAFTMNLPRLEKALYIRFC